MAVPAVQQTVDEGIYYAQMRQPQVPNTHPTGEQGRKDLPAVLAGECPGGAQRTMMSAVAKFAC